MKYAFQHDGKAFILKAEDGSTVRVGPRHDKHEYVQGVEAGRVIGISKSGRWTNAKDYDEVYDKVTFGKAKPPARAKTKVRKEKPAQKRSAKTEAKPKKTAKKPSRSSSSSRSEVKRIQSLDAQVSSLEQQVKDLNRRLKSSETKARDAEAKVGRLQDDLEAAALREAKALMLAVKYETKAKAKPARSSKPKGKRRVVKATAHVDLNWWKDKDYSLDPGGKGSSDFDVRIKCIKKHEYRRLTKSMVKDAVTSALEDSKYSTSAYVNGWKFEWSLVYGLNMGGYDSRRGVRVRVLAIEEDEHAIIG